MRVDDLAALDAADALDCDLVIIGCGPVGVTIAREFYGENTRIIVLESGIRQERADYNDFLTVESIGAPRGQAVIERRRAFHGAGAMMWSHEDQGFGLRCRIMGGSSHAWAGKSATFDEIDFSRRDWIPGSGWPVKREDMSGYFDRAAKHLNLGPNSYDESFFGLLGMKPTINATPTPLRSFFWQFARSRVDKMDMMRFGPEFATETAPNVRLVLNATVTHIDTDPATGAFTELEVSTLQGQKRKLKARACVVSTGGIENARLLLISNRVEPAGLGNRHDNVGRYLMDHLGARIGSWGKNAVKPLQKAFGFFGYTGENDIHMYQHGLAIRDLFQQQLKTTNAGIFFQEERAKDDPWDAIKRLLKRQSKSPIGDIFSALISFPLILKGVGMKLFKSPLMPGPLRNLIINTVLKLNPNMAVSEFQDRGVPHKLSGLVIEAVIEQPPRRESRITLSDKTDALGVPRAKVNWIIGDTEFRTYEAIAGLLTTALPQMGLPAPKLEPWGEQKDASMAAIIDMGHTCGTTRMSVNPADGVVDTNCMVHGSNGLFVCGASVFPTSGHANTTLMATSFAVRLADHLKAYLKQA